jgi:hypothetical protein
MQSSKLETRSIPPIPFSQSGGITKNLPFLKGGTPASYRSPEIERAIKSIEATADAHKTFLEFSTRLQNSYTQAFELQTKLLTTRNTMSKEQRTKSKDKPETRNQKPETRNEQGGDAKTDVSSCRGVAPEGYFET